MNKKRVFLSFDLINDKALRDSMFRQSKSVDSPFEVSNYSMGEATSEQSWENEARARIKQCDVIIVLVGSRTGKADNVRKEVAIAREEGIPIFQIVGYGEGPYEPVLGAGRAYSWNWDNLKKLLT